MNITNDMNLPQPLVSMCQKDYQYEPNEYRVTSLLKGIRETLLERRHESEITRDVSDMIWLLFGTAVHGILEKNQETDDQIKEARLKETVRLWCKENVPEYTLSGQFDLYDASKKKITDYKTASVWKIIFGNFEDWRRQLLIYGWLLRKAGFEVECAEIVAMLKDHSKRDAKIKSNYPPLPVATVPFKFKESDFEEIEIWLAHRFEEIYEAEKLPDDELPLCTPEERFNSGDKYAVMKNGRKTALRVLDSMEEATAYMLEVKGDRIDTRPGEDKKCIDYCSAAPFCSFYKERYAKTEVNENEPV